MAQKPRIDYINKYYSYGSEAVKVEPKERVLPKFQLPKIKLEKVHKIYIDPAALAGLAAAAVILVLMVLGSLHMRQTKAEYDRMKDYLSDLNRENALLSHVYHTSYDPDEIRAQAARIGMVDGEEAERYTIFFSVPEIPEKPSAWDEFLWLLSGLLSNPVRDGE